MDFVTYNFTEAGALAAKLATLNRQLSEARSTINQMESERHALMLPFMTAEPEKMTKEEKLKMVMSLPDLPGFLQDSLKEYGFMTGSSVYSDAIPLDEDWVINIPPSFFKGYALGTNQDYWKEDGMASVYAHIGPKVINIICISDIAMFKGWEKATTVMQHLHKTIQIPFASKWERVRVFRALKDIFTERPEYSAQYNRISDVNRALKFMRCIRCGYKAEMFTCKDQETRYYESGICEKCCEIMTGETHNG